MDDENEVFVLLKYEILTSDTSTWKRCEATYPASVKKKWAWRCASDVEHLTKGYPEAEECIRIAKLYRDGAATIKELSKAWREVPCADAAYHAAFAAYYASAAAYYAGYHAAGVDLAAASAYYAAAIDTEREEKWDLYIEWLIEELCEYEQLKENENEKE